MKKKTSSISIKRVLSLVFALVMVLAMSIPAFAETSDANMTNSYLQWTLEVAPGDSVTLYASPANASYTPTGFNTDATAEDVAWSSSNDGVAAVDKNSIGFETAPSDISGLSGIWCTKATVKVPSSAVTGSCSIEAKNTATGSSVNFTIIVKSAVTANAADISVYLPDYGVSLDAGTVDHTSMNFAAPMDAFKQLKADVASGFRFPKAVSAQSPDGKTLLTIETTVAADSKNNFRPIEIQLTDERQAAIHLTDVSPEINSTNYYDGSACGTYQAKVSEGTYQYTAFEPFTKVKLGSSSFHVKNGTAKQEIFLSLYDFEGVGASKNLNNYDKVAYSLKITGPDGKTDFPVGDSGLTAVLPVRDGEEDDAYTYAFIPEDRSYWGSSGKLWVYARNRTDLPV